ncbi:hypothetical protein NLU13_5638 [Sarocladium strictum]|uniref:C3H1-type domain-containing protein n=1 Tax=Sarocladium strictum TaxID=5046 RepID=A0AA39GH97_SARSR|nr:hypothetical protein NLU13_5638 [Sarocladium strictum]
MQSWQGMPGQPGADGQQNPAQDDVSWQQGYAFAQGGEHFDPSQDWSQSIAGQIPYQHLDAQDSANFFEAHPQHHQNGTYLSENVHSQEPAFQGAPSPLDFSHQYQQTAREAIDPSFESMHPDLYAHQGKVGIHTSQQQALPHEQQAFQEREYGFLQSGDRSYGDVGSQAYSQTHAPSHTPVSQQLQHTHPGQQQTGASKRQSRHPSAQHQQDFSQPGVYPPAQANGHPTHLPPGAQINFLAQQQPPQHEEQHPQAGFSQAQFTPSNTVGLQQHPSHGQNVPHIQQLPAASNHPVTSQVIATGSPQVHQVDSPVGQSALIEAQPKKRKRTVKSVPEAPSSDVISFQLDSHIDNSTSKLAEIDSLPPPQPTTEEVELINKFNKRTKAAKAKFPAINGLPYLVHGGMVTLPMPKSFDKLAPLVALPPRSGKRVVPELDYELPCQIQGRFSSQYQPSADKAGLDERKVEAQALLDEYDRSMRAIGKRQPKYTEYPHAFKEQLKADEANKNKAGKKAKKDGESSQRSKPIRSESRPSDPVEAAAWDAIGIVHIEPSVTRSSSLIATRVQQTGDFFIKLRGEMNRAKQELDQATTDKAPEMEISNLTKEYELKKKILYQALDAVIEHADDAVLDNLSGHQKLISSLVNVLISCIKAGDFSGKLPKVALELFTQMPMTRKIAETTNFETVRKRFAEKGDDEAKDLAKEIAIKVRKALKSAESESGGGYAGTSAANRTKAVVTKTIDGANAKRGRDEDGTDGRSVKKVIVEAGSGSLSKKLAPVKTSGPSMTKVAVAKTAPSSILPGKSRLTTKPAAKAAESAKAEGPSSAAKDEPKTEAKKPASKPASSASSSLSGIGSLLASINTPKAEASVATPKEVKRTDSLETPEQRAKRLRKEARRKLRVSWKPEGELVKIKIFEKEDSEDEGRAHNMTKDAADDRSEGMVLKQRADIDEDDEDDDIPYQPWEEPTLGVWTALPEETRNKNYVTRGGNVTFTTEEQEKIREREMRELMAFYQDVDDIPPSPKSPVPEPALPNGSVAVSFPSDNKFSEIHLRWRDEKQMGPDGALYAATRRLDARQGPGNKLDTILGRLHGSAPKVMQASPQPQQDSFTPSNAPLLMGAAAEEQLLAWLTSEKTRQWRDPQPSPGELRAYHYVDPETRLAGTAIEALVRYLAPKPYPVTSPPDWLLSDEERVREWWLGYNKEVAARQKKLEEERARVAAQAHALLAAAGAQTQGQQASNPDWLAWFAAQQQPQAQQPQAQQQASYEALLQQVAGGQQPAPAAAAIPQIHDDQLQSILAAINQPGQPQAPTFPASNSTEDPVQKYLAQLAQGNQHQSGGAVPPPPPSADRSREREWDRDWDRGDDDDRDYKSDGKGKKTRTLPPHKPINKALIGTKPCTFWQQGKCARGDKCTFRHD